MLSFCKHLTKHTFITFLLKKRKIFFFFFTAKEKNPLLPSIIKIRFSRKKKRTTDGGRKCTVFSFCMATCLNFTFRSNAFPRKKWFITQNTKTKFIIYDEPVQPKTTQRLKTGSQSDVTCGNDPPIESRHWRVGLSPSNENLDLIYSSFVFARLRGKHFILISTRAAQLHSHWVAIVSTLRNLCQPLQKGKKERDRDVVWRPR